MSDNGGGKRRKGGQNKRKFYGAKRQNTGGHPEPTNLTENLQGFLISCNNNEYQTLRESYNLLNEAADRLYGAYGSSADADSKSTAEVDIEASIAAEIASLKSSNERRFIQCKTKCNNVLFIRTNDDKVEPNALVADIFAQVRRSGQAHCRYIQRFIPVLGTFKAQEEEKLYAAFRELFSKYASKNVRSFSVMAKIRNNSAFKGETALRQQMIDIIRDERPNWLLNHAEPKEMVVLNITQRAGCVSILEDFAEYSKYNLVEYGKKCADKGDAKEKVEDSKEETVDNKDGTEAVNHEPVDLKKESEDVNDEPVVLQEDATDESKDEPTNEPEEAQELKEEQAKSDTLCPPSDLKKGVIDQLAMETLTPSIDTQPEIAAITSAI